MKSDLPALTTASAPPPDYAHEMLVVLAALLALAVIWLVLPAGPSEIWMLTAGVSYVALALIGWRSYQLCHAREQSGLVMAALGVATADIPAKLRTRMPLVLVTGDNLSALFDRVGEVRHAHVGDGAIWLRVDRAEDLPRLALALAQWRGGLAPDGVVLSIVPARYTDTEALTGQLRVLRQSMADTSRMMGRRLPGYVAVYQRLTTGTVPLATPRWYGISSNTRLVDDAWSDSVIQTAEHEVTRAGDSRAAAVRAAALASVIGWTQHVVFATLTDRLQPASPWPLFGAGWIDCGPASGPDNPWARDVQAQTQVTRAEATSSALPWPLPQPLIEALPRRYCVSPRVRFFAQTLAVIACAAAVAFWSSARNNQALLTRIGADLGHYSMIPTDHDAVRRDALRALVLDRDQLDRYGRAGVPLRLSFGMYRAARLLPVLNQAIASYAPPAPPPAVVTLDSMSLFDTGRAQLKPGSTRAMVGALEMIKAHSDKRILVAGYTDSVGNADRNQQLSMARAQAVRDWLIDVSGIPATQFAIQGYGNTRPIASNDTPEGRARNRRVEITLIPDTAVDRSRQ